jgi:hypothetical protein
MKLKSFGCSFIFGSELADAGYDRPFAHYSSSTWPALLAKDRGHDYQCYARPGSGNLQIAEQILSQTAHNEHALFVIGWTWIDRFDYTVGDRNTWQTILPADQTPEADFYYRNLHSQLRDKLSSLMSIKLTIDTLLQKKLPFVMTYMDDLLFETQWYNPPAVTDMQRHIRPYMTDFDGKNFLDWSRDQGFEITSASHPLESAHQAAFGYMKSQSNVMRQQL